MSNSVNFKEGKWYWVGDYESRSIPKSAGFRWNPAEKVWWTDRASVASILEKYFDSTARSRADISGDKNPIEESRAVEPLEQIEVPAPNCLQYKPYQLAGIQYALKREKVLIADEMGLGKTIQAIGVINVEAPKRVLIVCPKSVKLNWKKELEKWLILNYAIQLPSSTDILFGDIIIINPQIVGKLREKIDRMDWDLLVLDEFHFYKNPKSDRTLAVLGGTREENGTKVTINPIKSKKTIMLTGTPIPNRPVELWPVMKYTGVFSNWKYFVEKYCDGRKDRYGWNVSGASNLEMLQTVLRSNFMVRREKKEVLKYLPSKIRQIIDLEGGGFDLKIFGLSKDDDDFEKRIDDLLGEPGFFTELSQLRHNWGIQKIEPSIDFIENLLEEQEKIVVFCWHNDVANAIYEKFKEFGSVLCNGQTSEKDRFDAVQNFQEKSNIRVFVGTIGSAGVGITLTAASTVVMVESDWVPANLQQAEDRCHRIGQTDVVNIYYLVFQESIDGIILQKVIEKMDIQDRALDRKIDYSTTEINPEKKEVKKEKKEEVQKTYSHEEIEGIKCDLRRIADMCNYASTLDGCGFNKTDANFGHSLAACENWTQRMAAAGDKLVAKYRKQLESIK